MFGAKYVLRKPDKAQLQEAIRDYAASTENAVLQTIPHTDHHVLDGDSLLHRLKWTEGNTYNSVADRYASFVISHYGNATVVFDGYCGGPSTKDNMHQRQKSYVRNKVDISDATKFSRKKEGFLANDINKQAMIKLIGSRFQERGCCVIHDEADADVDIVKAAVTMLSYKSTTLVGEDTDLLILLLYYANDDCKDLYFRSDKDQMKPRVYNIKILKQLLGNDVCTDLLFAHAFTGCDTTSRVFGIGKKTVFNKIVNRSPKLQSCSQTFCTPNITQVSIEEAGCKALACLFSGTGSNLESLRCSILSSKVVTAKSFVKPERLPPTTSSAKFHALRTYLQVM